MRSDRLKVVKILSKLLGNAYKFTAEGEVRATVQVLNDLARFTVSDTGIGIPSAAHQLVFDEFRQVDGSTTPASTAAPGSALLSRGSWRGCSGGTSNSSRHPGKGRRSWWRSR